MDIYGVHDAHDARIYWSNLRQQGQGCFPGFNIEDIVSGPGLDSIYSHLGLVYGFLLLPGERLNDE
ncbi:hypothetical protein ES703_117730 [subsurface metagenome]